MLSLTESVRPLFSTFLLYSLTVIWALYSSYDVLHKHTRIFYWISGTVFSNIAVSILFLAFLYAADFRERSGSVVECLAQDRGAAGSSLTGVTALWSLSKTHLS